MIAASSVPPEAWQWCVEFVVSLGGALALGIAATLGVLVVDWLLEAAPRIAAQPTPQTFGGAWTNLLRMKVLAGLILIGIVLLPTAYSALLYGVWSLASWALRLAPPQIDADLSEANRVGPDMDRVAALLPMIGIASLLIVIAAYAILCFKTRRAGPARVDGTRRLLDRYFRRRWLTGLLLVLGFWPFTAYFLYDLVLLVTSRLGDGSEAFTPPPATQIALRVPPLLLSMLTWSGLAAAGWMVLRSILLGLRYRTENPAMNLVFRRTVKHWVTGGLCLAGSAAMAWWADVLLRLLFRA